MDVIFSPTVRKQMRDMPKADAQRIEAALAQIAQAHPERMPFVTELVGQPDVWRLRKGMWRAVYRLTGKTIEVLRVTKREDAYR